MHCPGCKRKMKAQQDGSMLCTKCRVYIGRRAVEGMRSEREGSARIAREMNRRVDALRDELKEKSKQVEFLQNELRGFKRRVAGDPVPLADSIALMAAQRLKATGSDVWLDVVEAVKPGLVEKIRERAKQKSAGD